MIALTRIGLLALFLLLWQGLALHMPNGLFATPLQTLAAARELLFTAKFWSAVGQSLRVYLLGLGLAAVVGIAFGVLLGTIPFLRRAFDPFINALAATPRVAFVPLIIVLLGLGLSAKVFIVFLGALMPILLNTITGVRAADQDLVEMARSFGKGPWQIFKGVVLPNAQPFLLTGLRIGATIGLINTVVAELYTAVSGLGGLLSTYGSRFRMAEYFVVVLTLCVIGICVTESLRALETRLTRWKNDRRSPDQKGKP